jgi:hypothetical protein
VWAVPLYHIALRAVVGRTVHSLLVANTHTNVDLYTLLHFTTTASERTLSQHLIMNAPLLTARERHRLAAAGSGSGTPNGKQKVVSLVNIKRPHSTSFDWSNANGSDSGTAAAAAVATAAPPSDFYTKKRRKEENNNSNNNGNNAGSSGVFSIGTAGGNDTGRDSNKAKKSRRDKKKHRR